METLLGWISLVMAALVGVFIVWQVRAGKHPILSARNFFLVGFIVYQLTSAAIAFFSQQYWEVPISSPESTGILFVLYASAFLIIMLAVYELKWFTFRIPNVLAKPAPAPSPVTMMSLAVGFLVVGFAMRLGFQFVPVIGVLGTMTGVTLAIAAAGMAVWVWSKQMFNPTRAAFAMAIVAPVLALTIFRTFGRRDLVSAAIVCLWAAYHGHFKRVNLSRTWLPLTGVAIAGLVVISAYTSVRSHESKQGGFVAQFTELFRADIKAGMIDIFAGQGTAPISMWLIETRPESFEYDTLHSLKYVAVNIIPRDWWPAKPESLGLYMVPQAAISNKGQGFTVGPGIVGHIANDNPYIALILYAVLLGAFLRILDEMVTLQPHNPFVVIPVGVALGEIVAIPRGESGLFVFRTILAVVAAYIGMRLIAKLLVAFGMRYNMQLAGAEDTPEQSNDALEASGQDADTGSSNTEGTPADEHAGLAMAHAPDEPQGRAQARVADAPRVPWGLQA